MGNFNAVIVALLAAGLAVVVPVGFLPPVVVVTAQAQENCGQYVTFSDCDERCWWCDVVLEYEGGDEDESCVDHARCSQHEDCRDVHYGTMAALFAGLTAENNNGHTAALQVIEFDTHSQYCHKDVPETYLFDNPDCNTCVEDSHKWCQYDLNLNGQVVSRGGLCSNTCDSSIVSDQFRGDGLTINTRQAVNREQCAEILFTTTAAPTTSAPSTTTEEVTTTTEKATTSTAEVTTTTEKATTTSATTVAAENTTTKSEKKTSTATTAATEKETTTTATAAAGGGVSTTTTATAGQVSSSTSVKTGQTSSEATNASGAATTPVTSSLSAVATMAAICVVAVVY